MAAWCEFEIIWMYGFDGRPLTADDIPEAVADLQTMGRFHGLQIYPDAEPAPDGHWQYPRVSVGWDREGEGYLVQCFETAYSESFFLATSSSLSEPEIYVELGGQGQELWPRQLFVPYPSVVQALEHFLATGLQDTRLAWIGLRDFPRLAVASRRDSPHLIREPRMTKAVAAKSLRRMKIELESLAEETFETADDAARWLRRPHPMLDDETPLDFAKSRRGAERVRDILLSIKYGNAV